MKKYNLSKIMKHAWNVYKTSWRNGRPFADALRYAWSCAKQEVEQAAAAASAKFVQDMILCVGNFEYTLRRWTKNGRDRIYVKCGKKENGYVDLKTGESFLRSSMSDSRKAAELIMSMQF